MLRILPFLLVATFTAPPVWAEEFEAPALIRSQARLELRSILSLPVSHAPLTDGARFAKGDLLIGFDCGTLKAQRRAAKAGVSAAAIKAKAKKRLVAHGAAGLDELAQAKAAHREASARRDALSAQMKACKLTAPFAGRIVRLDTRTGEVPATGAPVVTIIDDRQLDIEIVAPSHWLSWIRIGAPFEVEVEETGRRFATKIDAIGAEVDPVSRTVRIYGHVPTGTGTLPGMSGRAILGTAR